jgi:hypothetical protein
VNLIGLAARLGKTIAEIEEISISEYNEWIAYFMILEEREKDGTRPR